MSETKLATLCPKRLKLTLDGWAVTVAFLLALLVRAGMLKRVPW